MILQWEDQKFWPDVPPGEAVYIHKLAVRMIAWAKHTATAAGRRFLRLDCAPRPHLQAFYQSQGFTAHSHRIVGRFSVVRYEMILSKGQP